MGGVTLIGNLRIVVFPLKTIAKCVLCAIFFSIVIFCVAQVVIVTLLLWDIVVNSVTQSISEYPATPRLPASKEDNKASKANRKVWMRISDQVFVYSAHLDWRKFSAAPTLNNSSFHNELEGDVDKLKRVILVRIVGMKEIPPLRNFLRGNILDWFRLKGEMDYTEKYKCKLFFQKDNTLHQVSSTKVGYTVIEEGVKIYAGTYFNCYFSIGHNESLDLDQLQVAMYPLAVADYPAKLIDVGKSKEVERGSISICVRPLFGPFDDLPKLIQFVAYYHFMGVTKFNFYLMSVSIPVRNYLMDLSRKGGTLPRFILHDWNLPTGNSSELWDYGTLAALNDCLLSNMEQEYVVFVDVDEFIVPQRNDTLWSVINSYNRSTTYQYLVRNTFFCHEFCEKEIIPDVITNSISSGIFRCAHRTKRIWNVAMRSKFIVNPRMILSVGHHLVTKYVDLKTDFRFASGYSVQVSPGIALLNHYRECGSISSKKHPVLGRARVEDKTINRFETEVMKIMRKYYLPVDH